MDQDARRRLEEVLDREIEVARSLAETLAAERAALTGDSPEAVEQKAAEKIQILGTIEKLEAERRARWRGLDPCWFSAAVPMNPSSSNRRRAWTPT
jgi:hypothetical protein